MTIYNLIEEARVQLDQVHSAIREFDLIDAAHHVNEAQYVLDRMAVQA